MSAYPSRRKSEDLCVRAEGVMHYKYEEKGGQTSERVRAKKTPRQKNRAF